MGKKALEMMDSWFERLNIKKHVGKKIVSFVSDGVIFEDQSIIESVLTMFIPAGDGPEVLKSSDLPLYNSGFI